MAAIGIPHSTETYPHLRQAVRLPEPKASPARAARGAAGGGTEYA